MENLLNAKIMSDLKLNIDEFVEKQVDFFDILKRPIKTFAFGFWISICILSNPVAINIITGKVPKPKPAIITAPCSAEPLANDQVRTE